MPKESNQLSLAEDASVYLRERAADAVDWSDWNASSLQRAAQENKPILLSIGYQGCRWCRRMADESFREASCAGLINQRFVAIAVDRESRPDLDRIYHNAFQLLNGQAGGWPLTMVLSAGDGVPFFGAGYLAVEPRNGMPGFAELLQRLADYYRDRESEVVEQNKALSAALKAGPSRHGSTGFSLQANMLEQVIEEIKARFDSANGGFGEAPKFPQAPVLERLLRHYWHTSDKGSADTRAGFIAKFTLERMAQSPLQAADGGFFRYAHDSAWQQPEAEKPLADNAALLALYSQAAAITGSATLRQAAAAAADWLAGSLRVVNGGFHNAVIAATADAADDQWERQTHIRTAWNATAIKALALAGRCLQRPDLIATADQALQLIRQQRWHDGRLSALGGQPVAYLDDYAHLIDATLELLQCRWRSDDLGFAMALADVLMDSFQDTSKKGGFYFTATDQPLVLQRLKPIFDDALASGNGIAARAMIKLGHLSNSIRHLLAGERALKCAWPSVERNPVGCCGLLLALEEYYFPSQTVVIRGAPDAIEHWHQQLSQDPSPRRQVFAIPASEPADRLPPRLAECRPRDDVIGYLLTGNRRSEPLESVDDLRQVLASGELPQPDPRPVSATSLH